MFLRRLERDAFGRGVGVPRHDGSACFDGCSDRGQSNALAVGHAMFLDERSERRQILTKSARSGSQPLPGRELAMTLCPRCGHVFHPLTSREFDVLGELIIGGRNRIIAQHLAIEVSTVKTHMSHLLAKLGARNRTEAVIVAMRRGLIQ